MALANIRSRLYPSKRRAFWVLSILIALCIIAVAVVHHFWPFTESGVRNRLAEATSAHVEFGAFHEKYFPPGCVAENVVFRQQGDESPVLTIQRLDIRSGSIKLFSHHVSLIRADGLRLVLKKTVFKSTRTPEQDTTVDKLVGDDAELEVQRGNQAPLQFHFHQFRLENLGENGSTHFAAVFDNPLPRGLISTSGEFGPWNKSNPAATPVSGKYSLEHADLSVFGSIAGILSSVGDFKGTFKNIDVKGTTNAPDFQLTNTKHGLPLQTQFNATVNATAGDTILKSIQAKFGKDQIEAHGSFNRGADGKRLAVVDLECKQGRIEDTFYPFINASVSPLTGSVAFTMHVAIRGGKEQFVKRLQLKSDFRIRDARFTNMQTQTRLQKISEQPGQKDPGNSQESEPVDLAGRVTASDGTAQFTELTAHDQNASAQLRGTYSLVTERVDMHGKLATRASLTKTTSGIKAAFAKAIEPFFKKTHDEKIIPVKISGTFHHPNFGLDLTSKM
ncbi:MAG TPA: AsmA-like C-terminal region-containing protein [Terriglobales bacterium]|nr:AsmA-like C-terminal region-containing protein [Terriglobales bacterium]